MKILIFPYSKKNPYQQNLAKSLKTHNLETSFNSKEFSLRKILFNSETFDLLHLHWLPQDNIRKIYLLLRLIILKIKGIPFILTLHNLLPHETERNNLEITYRKIITRLAYGITVHSHDSLLIAQEIFAIPSEKIFVMKHGNYLDQTKIISQERAREKLDIDLDQNVFVYFGLIRPYKGVEELIESFQTAKIENSLLIILGKTDTPQLQKSLEEKIGFNPAIKFIPEFIEEEKLNLWLSATDFTVFPYKKIFTSGSIIKAMSVAKPVIAPRIGSLPEYLNEEFNYLYEPQEGNLKKQLEIATKEKNLAKQKGMSNYEQSQKDLDWNKIIQPLIQRIHKLDKSSVHVITEVPKNFYFYPLDYLESNEKIREFKLKSWRIFKPILKNLAIKIGLGKNRIYEAISFSQFIQRFLYPFSYSFFPGIIIAGLEPFDPKVIILLWWKLTKRRIIYYTSWPHWQGKWQPRKGGKLIRLVWKLFLKDQLVVSVTKASEDSLKRFCPQVKTKTIPHPIKNLPPMTQKQSQNNLIVSTLARLVPEKGLMELIQTAKELPSLEFWIISNGGPLKEEIEKEIKSSPNLKLKPGNQKEEFLSQSDVFVLNSYKTDNWEELFGMVIIEAMAHQLPVIATDCTGPKEIIENEVNGFIIPQKNNEELKRKIKYLAQNPDIRIKMGEKARRDTESKYSMETISQQWLDFLKKV